MTYSNRKMVKKMVAFKFDEEMIRFISKESKAQGTTKSAFVRKCIDTYKRRGTEIGFISKDIYG
jgi:predicted DNA-binding protein